MSDPTSMLPETTSAAWAAAQRETAGRIVFDDRLAQPSDTLLLRFDET